MASQASDEPGVLLVDDNPANLLSLEAILAPLEVRLTKATSGSQALRNLLSEDFAVILLDVQMVGMDGYETAALIKQRERTRNIPIIFLTAYGRDEADVREGYAHGAVDYLQKPFSPDVLRSKVAVFIELFRAQQQVRRQADLLRQQEATAREAAHRAADYIARLQALASRLTEATSLEQVIRALFEQGLPSLGAIAGSVCLLDSTGESLEVVQSVGYSEELVTRWKRVPVQSSTPLTDAFREARPYWLTSRADWQTHYPHMAHGTFSLAAAALPLLVRGRTLGAIGLSFSHERGFTEDDRAFFTAVAHACAQAIDRVRLYEEERLAHEQQRRDQEELRRRTEFEQQLIGIVSHDLRNPLGAITMAAGLLQATPGLSEQQLKAVRRIASSCDRATRLIRDFLDFTQARLGSGIPLNRRPMDLHEVTRHVVDEVLQAHPERQVQVEADGDGHGQWDPDRIAQVLTNLVGNALAYSPPGSPVRVHTEAGPNSALLVVSNQGTPIPPEMLPRLFEPLTRGEPTVGKQSRSIGLGLYIVQEIVRGHGGTVEVASSVETGTTFTVRLPRG
ncbi:hybrid sensor histidine kinase/response regulator [Hyalangium versicolor]|uniref:hybrid sensor histidine kinase/response regulator n=1 Tax=Hyalangium versicolor TaxID=2861190 RepID=UPI001CC946B3|nr:ATP-binding protein [Hyalangium versicolor]